MVTADQLVAHAVGDYILQSDWMANAKTKRSVAALAHVVTYSLPFLLLTRSPLALVVIAGTHFAIDRWRLARFVVWAKNRLAPRWSYPNADDGDWITRTKWWRAWSECSGTGYPQERPAWMAVWLLIIADNVLHVVINAIAIRYL